MDETNNFLNIHDFVAYWTEQNIMVVNSTGNANCEVLVSYSTGMKEDVTFRTNLTIVRNGNDDGKLSLKESNECSAEDYHLDFYARYQNIKFDNKTKSLIVNGQSGKVGKYEVHLSPV